MKISYNWLTDYISMGLSPEELSELLTNCGLEVESLEKYYPVRGGMKGLVVGEVVTSEKMPGSDHLSITTVNTGKGENLPIVCGAPNVAAGQKVIVATVGTTLYIDDKEIEIKKARIRGAESQGMICAEDEIGMGDSHEGIMVIDPGAIPGTPAAEYFGLEEDHIFEIGLTPNRTDAMSHLGVARDIKAVLENDENYDTDAASFQWHVPTVDDFRISANSPEVSVHVNDPLACPRYSGLTIRDVKVSESPDWLKNRLLSIGLRPLNNIVDITNYVLHETGQPLHAFDVDKISSNRIVVRKPSQGTPFVTLDGIERKLSKDDLMICDEQDGMCIAGVFGGYGSGVTEQTKHIFLESAVFDPVSIRKTAKYHDLQTDASFRFERGVDPGMTLFALKRAAILIGQITGGKVSSGIQDVVNDKFMKAKIHLSWSYTDTLIGKPIDREKIRNILVSLDFGILEESDEGLLLEAPLYRRDVTRPADVVEEILRIYGYNNIEIPDKVCASIPNRKHPDREKLQNMVSEYLTDNGFFEIMNNSLTSSDYYSGLDEFPDDPGVGIINPLSRELNMMRRSLLFGCLESVTHNINRQRPDMKFYEFGKIYGKLPKAEQGQGVAEKFSETTNLAVLITGQSRPESWYYAPGESDVFLLKAFLEGLFSRISVKSDELETGDEVPGYLQYGLSFNTSGEIVAIAGKVDPALTNRFDIQQEVFFAEINWDLLVDMTRGIRTRFEELPRFPEVRRDLALLLDKQVPYRSVRDLAYRTVKGLLKKVDLFDVYEGKNIGPGKKSYAVSFILQDRGKTLTDDIIDSSMNRLMEEYKSKLGAQIR